MKIRVLVFPVVFFGALALTHPAHSATITIKGHNPDQIQGKCDGGTFFPPGEKGGSYGCLGGDGSGIVCGGKGDNYANTCDTWGAPPADIKKRTALPTREEIQGHTTKMSNKPK